MAKTGNKGGYAGLCANYTANCKREDVDPFDQENSDSFNPLAVMYWMTERTYQRGSCNSIDSWSDALTWVARHLGMTVIPRPLHQNNNQYSDLATIKNLLL